uniref:Uncharacterized protein n=1 Tax=viral metagenome TaxID=1070528 RepID=A0A6H1ZJF5_9ZZZZ
MTRYKKRVAVGNFLKKGEDIKDGDIVEIANEGKQIEGKFGTQDVFLLKLKNGEEGNIPFNTTSINNLIEGFGEESSGWVGKEVKVMMIKQNVQGKIASVYYFLHPETVLDDNSGEFIIPSSSLKDREEIPVIESDEVEDANKEAQIISDEENDKA